MKNRSILPITRMIFGLVLFAATTLYIGGCSSSSTSPSTTSTVTATNDMQNTTIASAFHKSPSPSDGPTVDSLSITKVRVVMSGLHLHVSDDAAAGVGNFQSQPTVVTFTPGVVKPLGTATVPVGIYTQMIFDLHSVDPVADAALVAANPDFLVGGSSIIIDGVMVKNGTQSSFSYRTNMVRNLKPVFLPSPLITVAEQSYSANLRFDGKIAFAITSGKALDPTDPVNKTALDDQIAKAFLAQH